MRDAVAAYRNPDGGFGHALEPDGRCPGSQPLAIALALATLDEAGAWDDELVLGTSGGWKVHAPAAGGVVEADPSIEGWPCAPWWAAMDRQLPSVITTGLIAGTLHARRVRHPWLDRATELEWAMISELTTASPYQMRAVMHFLDRVPDRDRAVKAFGQCGPLILDQGLVTLDPAAPGEIHTPLDFAPLPGSLARSLFRPEVIDGAPGPPGRGPAATTAAGCSTGRPGHRPRPPTGAARSRWTRCACSAATAAVKPTGRRGRLRSGRGATAQLC